MASASASAEEIRLDEDARRKQNWKRWGPYLSERQWATVREDYSADGSCWEYFPHDHARSRAYRWGEDGLLGICDRQCRLCFALALWNGRDPILKERMFGLTGSEGNHGEDVKEQYFYLDSTPTHSYLKALYKYPQSEFPYSQLVEENRRRGRDLPEYELLDTGAFADGRYFDVLVEYAKASPEDILIRMTVANRGPQKALLHLLPTLWFRNTWQWGCSHEGCTPKPKLCMSAPGLITADHLNLGRYHLQVETGREQGKPHILFTENETNVRRVFGVENDGRYFKDAFHEYVVHGRTEAVNPQSVGTKAAVHYVMNIPAGGEARVQMRLSADSAKPVTPFDQAFDAIFKERIAEADEFYASRMSAGLQSEQRLISRQAYAGLLWSKQFFHYSVRDWLEGDSAGPTPPPQRKAGRNSDWQHLYNRDIISMPDKWEYPWYAAWDLAFHMIPFARIDPKFAKDQLVLMLREWYMHPNGQIPAYEFAFGDVNPPVHAWACWRVYKMTGQKGKRDVTFLARVFQKLLINFTWWVNRKDLDGKHVFSGGFLGLDNIGVFDRSKPLPGGGRLQQADGTAWMAFYCATMLSMALELAEHDPSYEDVASKFFEHFVAIADAINTLGGTGLWNEEDGFYYDELSIEGKSQPLRLRSMVGIIPLFAVEVLDGHVLKRLPGFRNRMNWFLEHRKDLARHISYMHHIEHGEDAHYLLAIPSRERLERALARILDEKEFLSPFGVRSLSAAYRDDPFLFEADGQAYSVSYVPGESRTGMFGGNSNWRGPIWMPVNFLLIEALERYHYFYGDSLKVECPAGSGNMMTLEKVARELSKRLAAIFLADRTGRRPHDGRDALFANDDHWRNLPQFHEYFHGDDGSGLGASHQTGWTALITRMLDDLARNSIK
jgi:hypothetical protein